MKLLRKYIKGSSRKTSCLLSMGNRLEGPPQSPSLSDFNFGDTVVEASEFYWCTTWILMQMRFVKENEVKETRYITFNA
jgi:hypothetical protein